MEDFSQRQYPAVGSCIYCGSRENLSREHIIPLGLGGKTTLPKASCARCAVITGKVERSVLRGSMWPARALLKMRSRRPEEAPTSKTLTAIREGTEQEVELPLEDYPILLPMSVFEPPGYLTGVSSTNGIQLVGTDVLNFGTTPTEAALRLGADSLKISQLEWPVTFAQMIGKIGYSFAVAELGLEEIKDLGIIASILGEMNEIGRWVGTLKRDERAIPGLVHRLSLRVIEPQNIIVSEVQLFADSSGPTYGAVVGRLKTSSDS